MLTILSYIPPPTTTTKKRVEAQPVNLARLLYPSAPSAMKAATRTAMASTCCSSTSCTSRTRVSGLGSLSASLHLSFFATATHSKPSSKRTLSVSSPPPIIGEPASGAATAIPGFVAEDDSNTCNTKNSGEEITMKSVVLPSPAADLLETLQSGITKPEIVRDDAAVEKVLEEAWDFLQQQQLQRTVAASTTMHDSCSFSQTTTSTTSLLLLRRMQEFLDAWISMHVQLVTRPQTSRPFQILLEAWSSAAFQNNNVLTPVDSLHDSRRSSSLPATEACHVLQRWYELLGGSIDMTPGMEHYHQLLATYANVLTNILDVMQSQQSQQQQHQQQNSTSPDQLLLQMNSLAMEAWAIVDQLKSWGYTYAPTSETNAHLIRCLSRVAVASCYSSNRNSDVLLFISSSDDHEDDTSTFDHNALRSWNRMLRTMEEIIGRMDSKKTKVLDEEYGKESFYQLQALCDALLAAKTVMSKHGNTNNRHQKRLSSTGVGALESNSLLSWQPWGTTLAALFLQQADRLSSSLDFGELNLLPYDPNHARQKHLSASVNSQPLSSAYQLLTTGCEAWQFLLCHCSPRSTLDYYHQQQQRQSPPQNQLLVASEIHDVLDRLEDIGRQRHTITGDLNNSPMIYSALLRHYLLTIKAWEYEMPHLESRDKERAMQRRDELLQRWEAHHKNLLSARAATGISTIAEKKNRKILQVQSFNNLMLARFKIGQVNEVFALFQKMKDFRLQADATSYSAVLKSLADSTRNGAAEDAYKIWQSLTSSWRKNPALESTVKPISQHYASVLVAWSRSRQSQGIAANRVLDVFYKLQRDCEFDFQRSDGNPTLKLSPIHYAMVLRTLARSRQRTQEIDAATLELAKKATSQGPPDARINNAAMNALSRVGTMEAATMAQNLLDEMEYHHRQTGDPSVKPTAKNYGYCMNAWARSAVKEGPLNAHRNIEDLLLRLETEFLASGNDPSLLPGSAVYYMLLTSLINTGVSDMGDKADAILHQLVEKAAMGQAEYPSEFVYNKVIEAHRKGNAKDCAEKAEAVLHMILAAYSHALDKPSSTKPTASSYNGVIHAWSRSSQPNKAARAASLLHELEQLFELAGDEKLMPDDFTYTAVLNTCAHLPGKSDPRYRMEALRIALQTIQKVEARHGLATSYMFYLALKTCYDNSQGSRQQTECAIVLFESCCRQGLVNKSILDILRLCAPLFYQKLPSSLPSGWTMNARG